MVLLGTCSLLHVCNASGTTVTGRVAAITVVTLMGLWPAACAITGSKFFKLPTGVGLQVIM